MKLHRRRFLKLSGAGAALSLSAIPLGCGPASAPPEAPPEDGAAPSDFDPDAFTEDEALFSRGVQAGAMTADAAILWSFASASVAARLHVYRRSPSGSVLMQQSLDAVQVDGFFKHRVTGLGPAWYEYVFTTADGRRSRVGRFRTAFAARDLRPLSIGALVCTKLEHAPWDAIGLTLEESPDLLCHLGDFVYADGAETLEEYRAIWQRTFDEGSYREHLARAGLYYTWDDHEFMNNVDPTVMKAEHPAQWDAARKAALESIASDQGPEKIWGSYRWGRTAEIFVLDSRTERVVSSRETPDATYLSTAQLDWLSQGLTESPCRYKIVMSSVPFARMPELWAAGVRDRWQGYAAQRQKLLDRLLGADVRDVIFLSGDFHCGLVMRVEPEGPARRYWEITVGPTGNGPNPIAVLADGGYLDRASVFPSQQFLYGSGIWPAATTITLDPLRDEVRVRFVDARPGTRGAVLFDGYLPKDS
ncbi:MAG: alkaline phosphatase D family protein [Myxococcota bacterium]